ncbi:MAG: hypothetical protein ACD_19C00014G0034 [uncultured bacterium]|nr:MAG: hypothetical protein ACD_19C00014G0034 [uncultured bacterium]
MSLTSYKELLVYQKSKQLTVDIIQHFSNLFALKVRP